MKRFFLLLLLLIVVQSTALFAQFDDTIIYLEWAPGEDPLRSIVINWITDSGVGVSQIDYRAGSSGGWTTRSGSSNSIPDVGKQRHSVELDGLSPGTSYQFRITDGNPTSDTHQFRTPPGNINNPIRFIVGGDLYTADGGTLDNRFRQVATQAASQNPYFAVLGGDLANADASAANIDHWFSLLSSWYQTMVTPNGHLIPFVAVLGNHEFPIDYNNSPSDARYVNAFFTYPGSQHYGVLDFSDYLSILTLNTRHSVPIAGTQTNWLEDRLDERTNVDHVFPVSHVPAWPGYDNVSDDGTHNDVLENWVPLFEEYGLRYVFEHSENVFKQTFPLMSYPGYSGGILNRGSIDEEGIIYMGGGGWGTPIPGNAPRAEAGDPNKAWWYVDETKAGHHFIVAEISSTYMKATAIDYEGDVLSEVMDLIYLDPPEMKDPTNITDDSFTVNWKSVDGAKGYELDISSNNFSDTDTYSFGQRTDYTLENLPTNTTYQYRVRAVIPRLKPVVSENSDVQSVRLVKPDPDESELEASVNQVLADGSEQSTITATIRNANGEALDDLIVTLSQAGGDSDITTVQGTTDSNGEAIFRVQSDVAEHVTYTVQAVGTVVSQTATVSFVPLAPEIKSATNATETSFRANWEDVQGDVSFRLDVSTESDFSAFVEGYENLGVGSGTSRSVNGLTTNTTYFYRVRAMIPDLNGNSFVSSHSESSTIKLFRVDPDKSGIEISEQEVVADGTAFSTITVTASNEFDEELAGLSVTLNQAGGNSQIETVQGSTDSDGIATFRVRNNMVEEVNYSATVRDTELSQTVSVNFIPVPPTVESASQVNATTFRANWQSVSGADSYRLDVSPSETFDTFLSGYEDLDVSTMTSRTINGLTPGTLYYYRVRNVTGSSTSYNSEVMSVMTLQADPDLTTITATPTELIADGESESSIVVWVRDENSTDLSGVPVVLTQGDGQSDITTVQGITDVNGEALFTVTNTTAQRVNYSATAGVIDINTVEQVNFTPQPPAVQDANEIGALLFTANWGEVAGATGYELDVSTSPDFNSFVAGYQSLEVPPEPEYQVANLSPGTTYYYRVRAIAQTGTSDNSGVTSLETLTINSEASTIESSALKILANGLQDVIFTVNVVDDDNNPVEGVPVYLETEAQNTTIEPVDEAQSSGEASVTSEDAITDEFGDASFSIASETTGPVTFTVFAGGVELSQKMTVEFIQVSDEPEIGNNFPNPFRGRTTIPVTLPEAGHVRLYIISYLGQRALTLIDREMPAGYYEVSADLSSLAASTYFYWLIVDNEPIDSKALSSQ